MNNGFSISQDETSDQGLQATEVSNSPIRAGDIQGTYEATEMPNIPHEAGDIQGNYDEAMPLTDNDPDNAMIHEQQRQIDILCQALADTKEPPPMTGK